MDAIAAESGVGRRTVYNHFDSKKELFDATIARLWEGMPLGEIAAEADGTQSPREALLQIGSAIADFWAADDAIALMRLIISEGPRFPELVRSYIALGRGPARRAVATFLRSMDEAGAFAIQDAEHAAMQFISLINGPLLWNRVVGGIEAPSHRQQDYVVAEAVETFLCRFGAS